MYTKFRYFLIYYEKRFNISFHYFSIFRLLTHLIGKFFLKRIDNSLIKLGNYKFFELDKNKKLNVISAGIARNASFEIEMASKYSINKMILIDPTSESKKYINDLKLNFNYEFLNVALSDRSGESKLYYPPDILDNLNYSLDNLFNRKKYKIIKTTTLNKIFDDYDIKNCDILKVDIEGYEDRVLEKIIKDNIFPEYICFDLTKPFKLSRQLEFLIRVFKILRYLKKYYEMYDVTELKIGYRLEVIGKKLIKE